MAQVTPYGVLYFPPPPPSDASGAFPGANRLSLTPVKDVITERTVEWISNADSCQVAATKMLERNIGLLPVKDSVNNYLVGVITDRDLVTRVAAKSLDPAATRVSVAMTAPVLAMVYEDADLCAAERLMVDRSVRRLLVLRREDNVVSGVLSVDDIAKAGLRRRAGEILRGAASLAITPEDKQKLTSLVGQPSHAIIDTDPHISTSVYTVRDVMGSTVEWIGENETCTMAAKKLLDRAIGCLPVCGPGGSVAGVITDRDLVTRVMARGGNFDSTTVASVMSRQVVCCFSDDNLAEAEKLMLERCVRRVLVLQRGTNQLVGVVSVDDIALLASRGRAGRVLEHLGATPNEVFRSASVVSSSMDMGTHA